MFTTAAALRCLILPAVCMVAGALAGCVWAWNAPLGLSHACASEVAQQACLPGQEATLAAAQRAEDAWRTTAEQEHGLWSIVSRGLGPLASLLLLRGRVFGAGLVAVLPLAGVAWCMGAGHAAWRLQRALPALPQQARLLHGALCVLLAVLGVLLALPAAVPTSGCAAVAIALGLTGLYCLRACLPASPGAGVLVEADLE